MRRRQLRSWLRHDGMTVAMALAEMTHHTAPRGPKMARAGEGRERAELHNDDHLMKSPAGPDLTASPASGRRNGLLSLLPSTPPCSSPPNPPPHTKESLHESQNCRCACMRNCDPHVVITRFLQHQCVYDKLDMTEKDVACTHIPCLWHTCVRLRACSVGVVVRGFPPPCTSSRQSDS